MPAHMVRTLLALCIGCSTCDRAVEDPVGADSEPVLVDAVWSEVSFPAAPGSMGASLTATDGGLLATWIEPIERGHRVRFARFDGSWGDVYTVVEGEALIANWADFPRSALGGDGAVYVHHLHRAGEAAYAYEIRLSRMREDAFESLGVVHRDGTPTEHGFVSMVPTPDGVRLFWLDGRATVRDGATQVFTAEVNETIGEAQPIDERVCDCCQTDAVMTPGGPLVAFRDRSDSEIRDIAFSRWDGAAFSAPRSVHDDGWEIAGCPVNGPQLSVHGESTVVAWFTGARGGVVHVAFDEGDAFGTPIEVDARQPPGRVDVAALDDGAAVSWLARGRDSGEVRVRFVGRDGRLGAPTRVGTASVERDSGFPVMARWREHLYVGHRAGDAVRLARLAIAALPRAPGEPDEELAARVEVGAECPVARVETEEGVADLAERGPRVVAFYARWCQPCREELRMLERLREELPILAVSVDEGTLERATGVARGWGFEGEVARDGGAASILGVPPLPGTFVIGADGKLRLVAAGRLTNADELRAALR